MSDHWEMFPCVMGGHSTFISFDFGIRDELATLPYGNCLRVRIELKSPSPEGLSTQGEFAALVAIEDAFIAALALESGVQVGRITGNGRRELVFYTSLDDAAVAAIRDRIDVDSGYPLATHLQADPARDGYWQSLYPTDEDWQVIKDMRVENALRERGDPLAAERPIDHWAMFADDAGRAGFLAAVADRFEIVHQGHDPDAAVHPFHVQLRASSLPDYLSMNATTLFLLRTAAQHGGRYDGWESIVCGE